MLVVVSKLHHQAQAIFKLIVSANVFTCEGGVFNKRETNPGFQKQRSLFDCANLLDQNRRDCQHKIGIVVIFRPVFPEINARFPVQQDVIADI